MVSSLLAKSGFADFWILESALTSCLNAWLMTMVTSWSIKLRVSLSKATKILFNNIFRFLDLVQHYQDWADTEGKEEEIDWLKKFFEFIDENGTGKLSKVVAKAGIETTVHLEWEDDMGDDDFEILKDDQGEVSIDGEMIHMI